MLVAASATAHAQLPVPRLNSIFPCGARQSATVECTVAGGELDGATGLLFSHPGITAEAAGPNKFKVTVANTVPVGPYDVRVVTPHGVSNFRAFNVGDCPEALEKEPNNELGQAIRVAMPVVVNGRVDNQTDVDHYIFAAKKGQRVIIDCRAWRIDSQLDGTLMLFDSKGKEIAYNGDCYGKDPFLDVTIPEDGDYIVKIWDFVYSGGSDYFYRLHISTLPHIDAILPAALKPGTKNTVTIYGRNLPDGKPAPKEMAVDGRPLEMITREIEVAGDPVEALKLRGGEAVRPGQTSLDGMAYRLTTADGSSNAIFLAYATDPIILEQEPNNEREKAQKLPIPCDLTGSFGAKSDLDYYSFTAKKGEKIVVEIFGERQSGMVDPNLTGLDATGKRIFTADDNGRNIGQLRFATNSRDARWDFTAPADGEYFIQVRDLYHQQRGDPRLTYRLSIHRPQPDFRLIVVPSSDVLPDATVIGRGGKYWMDALAFRNDGFDGPIHVEARNLPAGVTCPPVVIGPGKTSAPLVFHASADAALGAAMIEVVGKADINGEATRVARGGGMTWPTVNTPGIARLADSIVLSVRQASPFAVTAGTERITGKPGQKVAIPMKVERAADWAESIQFSGYDLPPGATVALVTVAKDGKEGAVEVAVPMNAKPGVYTFTIQGAGQVARDYGRPADPKKPRGNNVRVVMPSNAITLTIEAP